MPLTGRKPTNYDSRADALRILFVEDDDNYREIVSDELEWHGFAVRSFADGESLLGSLDCVADADLIVLDWHLPTISGIDLLTDLRQYGVNLPVVFLTSHADVANERQAFARGAVDFMDKTRGVEILVSRLKLVASRPSDPPEVDDAIACGNLMLRPNIGRAYWREVDVDLTTSEYDIV